MTKHVASRTLVKSPPELWAECSDAASLARHLDQFGEIRITRLEPETAVAWEGERARGTVRIEPSGWGTKVILTAVAVEENRAKDGGRIEKDASEPEPVTVGSSRWRSLSLRWRPWAARSPSRSTTQLLPRKPTPGRHGSPSRSR